MTSWARYSPCAIKAWSDITLYCIQHNKNMTEHNLKFVLKTDTPYHTLWVSYGMPSVRILENIDHAIMALHCIWCLHRIELNAMIITKSATPYFHYSLDKHSYLSQIHSILTYASHVLCDFHNRSHFWISSCMTSANQRVHSNNDKAVLKIRTICHAWNLSKPAIDNKQGKS